MHMRLLCLGCVAALVLSIAGSVGCRGKRQTAHRVDDTPPAFRPLELATYGVIADDPEKASVNRRAIQRAIDEQSGRRVSLVLPPGTIYIDRGANLISLRFSGSRDLELAGHADGTSRIVIEGDAGGGYWVGIEIYDGSQRISLRDFAIEHGRFEHPSPTQQNHLIQVNAQKQITSDIEIQNIVFGPCIGDALRIAGTAPNYVSRLKVHDFVMRTNGHPNAPYQGARSGVSLQRGFRDVEIYDFHIYGSKNSPIDMEPTASAPMDDLNIHDGVIDNTAGATVYAVSLGGWEDGTRRVTPMRNSKFRNVVIIEGQITLVNTESLEVSDVTMYASGNGPLAESQAPMIYVYHENTNLRLANIEILRDVGAGTGALLAVSHGVDTYPSNIEISGGTWISRVDPDVKGRAYVSFESAHYVRMHGTRLQLEGKDPWDKYGIRFRSSARDVRSVDLDGIRMTSPHGKLAAGVWMAATNARTISDVRIRSITAPDATNYGVMFDATPGSNIDGAPVLEENDFSRSVSDWTAANSATNRVNPRIKFRGKTP